jgi:DNA-binding transcriptional LysR family regulator
VFAQHHLKRTTAFEVSDIQFAIQFVANGLGIAIVLSAVARSFNGSADETAACPPGGSLFFRSPSKKLLTGTDTVDLFLEKMADHCVTCGLLMVRNGNGHTWTNCVGGSGRS